MRPLVPWLVFSLALLFATGEAPGQAGTSSIVFVSTRPPRDLTGNIHGWASGHAVHSYVEDTQAHVWRVQFMAFLSRAPNASEVTLVFYHIERDRSNTRRYVRNEPVALSNPADRIFYHHTVLSRAAGEFEPMENYEVALTVADAHGNHEIARGRLGLVGQVERHDGMVDFTGANGPTVH